MKDTILHILFVWYPYVCISSFVFGSLIRYDREQYTWKAGSSQLLRRRQLFWGSNLFHFGVLFLFFGHFFGLLTPEFVYSRFISPEHKQWVAIISGGIAGTLAFIGLTLLVHRRLFDPRVRQTSTYMDLAILVIIWVQLILGLFTIPYSISHHDPGVMIALANWAQGIVTVQPIDTSALTHVEWPFLVHLVLGMTIFLLFPFSRLVHIWSAPVKYVVARRGYQIVRTRRPLGADSRQQGSYSEAGE
ncbi:MAG: respiratory nitrate reductase subunit gamma [Hyphomicrobiaceae bacterium]